MNVTKVSRAANEREMGVGKGLDDMKDLWKDLLKSGLSGHGGENCFTGSFKRGTHCC